MTDASGRTVPGSGSRRPVSVIVPTYNEEANLFECLDSVRFADEIMVVDSFSTDGTLEIARGFGARILEHEYVYSARQKNWAIPQAANEWVLLVDADERVTSGLREEILGLLRDGPAADAYWIRRSNHFLGRRIRHCGWGGDTVIRFFRRDVARYQDRRVHAEIELSGALPTLTHPIEHHTFRSFGQYWRKLELYSEWGAAQMYAEGKRAGAMKVFLRPLGRFIRMYFLRLGFLDRAHGLVLSMFGAFTVYLKYARLWEMTILRTNPATVPPVATAGPLVEEQIGRILDEDMGTARSASAGPGPADPSGRAR